MTDVTDQQLREVEAVAPMYPNFLIGFVVFGCYLGDFEEMMQHDPRILAAIHTGRAVGQQKVCGALYAKALSGDVDAIRYLEQTRYGVQP